MLYLVFNQKIYPFDYFDLMPDSFYLYFHKHFLFNFNNSDNFNSFINFIKFYDFFFIEFYFWVLRYMRRINLSRSLFAKKASPKYGKKYNKSYYKNGRRFKKFHYKYGKRFSLTSFFPPGFYLEPYPYRKKKKPFFFKRPRFLREFDL